MDIVPAIEEKTGEEFAVALEKVSGFAKRVHVDFNDGSFQGFVSAKPDELGVLPGDVQLEAHLMVANPSGHEWFEKLRDLGFRKFIIQWECEDNVRDVLERFLEEEVLVGVAVAPETPISDLEPVLDLIDSVVVMTVEPGKQGQEFLAENLKKVQELREGNFFGEVQVDGGINENDIKKIVAYQPETVIVGSHIVKSSNPAEAYQRLIDLISN